MKTLKNYIGIIGLCFTIIVSSNLFSQEKSNVKKLFVRVYGLDGKKIGKGHVNFLNDTLLVLKKNRKLIQFAVRNIGTIKTKRSAGMIYF